MARRKYVFDGSSQKMIEIPTDTGGHLTHGIHADEMEATKHPVDGKYYTSQAKFREVTKAHGYVEMGNEAVGQNDPGPAAENRESQEFINRTQAYLSGDNSDRVREINNYLRNKKR